ncbi:ABC transporter ATP-binding protein [Methylobrevis pamukkalensis]|uniref:Spermidine/putrescine import ATP-binding protein PotA n=1 Tax=Methylobrevis pamukkalensis TaxID=1439726 RepID=A0A1E3GYA1_9HYPH|nr:ABC transporter ATP-binding protein [Methylobrevis pamukkalensis]ODN69040.1 Spermidine/putrescine import ATP-binding protein PotA [Methylobrevis pamukkalensis]
MAERTAVEARRITRIFGSGTAAVKALDDVSVEIRANEFFTLLGPSGCGKTTLLRMIAGFEFPDAGEILLDGADIAALPPYRRPVNTVFQNYALFPHLTVRQNIAFGLEMLGRARAKIDARVNEMLRLVRMEELGDRRCDQISGGQQQRVALARALAPEPRVLLLDEPLSALDYKLRKEMQVELKRMQHQTGITFVFVTHDQEEALTMSDRVAVMSRGKILQIGDAREIYEHPVNRFVADFIGESNFLSGTVAAVHDGRAEVRLDDGPVIMAEVPRGLTPTGRVSLVVRPEHGELAPPGGGGLAGTVETVIYSGTDTHHRVRLDGGGLFIVRSQNRRGVAGGRAEGERVAIRVPDGAAQILRD